MNGAKMEEEVDWMKVEEENLTEPPALRANAMKFGDIGFGVLVIHLSSELTS